MALSQQNRQCSDDFVSCRVRSLFLIVALVTLAGCEPGPRTLTFVAANPPERNTIRIITELVSANSNLEFEIVVAEPGRSPADYVASGEADLAIVPNDMAYMPGVNSSVPVQTSLLHIMHAADQSASSIQELMASGEVFAGPQDSSAYGIARRLAELSALDPEVLSPQAGMRPQEVPNQTVLFMLGPISPQFDRLLRNRRLFSLGDPQMLGFGTIAEGLAARISQARPFVIPGYTYGAAMPDPILTLALDSHIVINAEVPGFTAFFFTEALVENRAQLASTRPALFEAIREDFDRTALNFPLHPGVRRFLDRDQPTLVERYAEVLNVGVYLLILVVTAVVAAIRWHLRSKKERADAYYARVLEIRNHGPYLTAQDNKAALNAVREIYDEAFGKLMDERLAANESFQILISLCDNTLRDIQQQYPPTQPRAPSIQA